MRIKYYVAVLYTKFKNYKFLHFTPFVLRLSDIKANDEKCLKIDHECNVFSM